MHTYNISYIPIHPCICPSIDPYIDWTWAFKCTWLLALANHQISQGLSYGPWLLPRTIYRPRPSWGLGMGLGLPNLFAKDDLSQGPYEGLGVALGLRTLVCQGPYKPRPSWGLGMGLACQNLFAKDHISQGPHGALAWALAYKAQWLFPTTIKANPQYPWHGPSLTKQRYSLQGLWAKATKKALADMGLGCQ